MRLKVPLTGRVIDYNPELAKLDGIGLSGGPNDPVRLVPIDLGNVGWRLVSIDLDNDLAEIEVEPAQRKSQLKDDGNPDDPQDYITVPTTTQDRQQLLDNARQIVESKTSEELYSLTKAAKLIKPTEVMKKYQEARLELE